MSEMSLLVQKITFMILSVKILSYCYYTQISFKKQFQTDSECTYRIHNTNEFIMHTYHKTVWEKSRLSLVYVRRENNEYLKIYLSSGKIWQRKEDDKGMKENLIKGKLNMAQGMGMANQLELISVMLAAAPGR